MNLHGVGVSRSERIAPIGEAISIEPPTPESELTLGQKMVLLKLRKGELAAAILEKLKAMSAPEPSGADWRACIDARYIRRSFTNSPTGRLELLPPGLSAVGAIMRELAPKYGVHIITYRPKAARSNMGPMASCSCGNWHKVVGRSDSEQSRLHRLAGEHLESARLGIVTPTRPLHEFLNEIAPLQLDLSGHHSPRTERL